MRMQRRGPSEGIRLAGRAAHHWQADVRGGEQEEMSALRKLSVFHFGERINNGTETFPDDHRRMRPRTQLGEGNRLRILTMPRPFRHVRFW